MTQHSWFLEFCEKTTSHCMQYFAMKKRSLAEKFFWTLVFFCMTLIAFSEISSLFNTWMHSPTILFIENTESEIQEIPFPSITICSSNQLRKSTWEKYKNMNDTYWKNLQLYRSILCQFNDKIYKHNLANHSIEFYDYKLFQNLIMNCAVSCSELFQFPMQWQNRTIKNICSIVQPILTVHGLCYSINKVPWYEMFNEKYRQRFTEFFSNNNTYNNTEDTLENEYLHFSRDNFLLGVSTARMSGVSYYNRLKLRIYSLGNEFLKCPGLSYPDGYFYVVVSNPANHFLFETKYFVIPETHTKFQITAIMKKIRWDLKWRSLEVRKCYLQNERKLSIFQQYSQTNCFSECTLNESITMCDCIDIRLALISMDTMFKMKCNCLPSCSMIDYDVTATSNIDRWDYLKITNLSTNKSWGATVEFAFKYPYYTAYETASIFSVSTLISTVGGILSLILGLNLLNIFEILYVVMKMIYNYAIHMFDT